MQHFRAHAVHYSKCNVRPVLRWIYMNAERAFAKRRVHDFYDCVRHRARIRVGRKAAAVAYGLKVWLGRVQRSNSEKGKELYSDRYLSRWHRDNPGQGCTAAALAQELARSTSELKTAFEQGLENILSAKRGDRKEAIFQAAAMIGGIVLARAVQDHRLSDEILKSVRQKLG